MFQGAAKCCQDTSLAHQEKWVRNISKQYSHISGYPPEQYLTCQLMAQCDKKRDGVSRPAGKLLQDAYTSLYQFKVTLQAHSFSATSQTPEGKFHHPPARDRREGIIAECFP